MMIEIDGSYEEGGGQILRTALSLSILTKKAFRINNIRKKRNNPGLAPQHLACIKLAAEFSDAYVDGKKLGSTDVEFIPRQLKNRQIELSIGTAGSTLLALQSILLPLLFTDSSVRITGGTDVNYSIPTDYFAYTYLPFLKEFGGIDFTVERRGYYPRGGGKIKLISRAKYKVLNFDHFRKFHDYCFGNPVLKRDTCGKLISFIVKTHATTDLENSKVCERMAKTAALYLNAHAQTSTSTEYAQSDSTGGGIFINALFQGPGGKEEDQYRLGYDQPIKKGITAESIGKEAADRMLALVQQETTLDPCMQDNIIPFLGLFGGRVLASEITPHTKANIMVCEKFLNVKYEIEKSQAHKDASFISVLSSNKS